MTARQQAVPERFGRRARRERERREWSLRDLAEKTGLAPSTVMRMEQGRDPALSTAILVASALELRLDWLLAETACETCDGMPPAGFACLSCGTGRDG